MQRLPNAQEIGSAIFRMRESRGLSIDASAANACVATSEWLAIECGENDLTVEMLWVMAHALDVRPSELMEAIEFGTDYFN